MSHWTAFLEAVPWFLAPGQSARTGVTQPPTTWRPAAVFRDLFPTLTQLLLRAHVTNVEVAGRRLVLFSWPRDEGISCWLSEEPPRNIPKSVHDAHATLLGSFGGIVERSDEPVSWILNHSAVLTVGEAEHDASFLDDYAWAFPSGSVPLSTGSYYSIAREANGNTTLCHRKTGDVLLFASDHSFDYVRPWRGLPEYTLYELVGAPHFVAYVETVAEQWLSAME